MKRQGGMRLYDRPTVKRQYDDLRHEIELMVMQRGGWIAVGSRLGMGAIIKKRWSNPVNLPDLAGLKNLIKSIPEQQ